MVCSLLLLFALQPDTGSIRRLFEQNLAQQEKQYGAGDARTSGAARDLGLFLKNEGDVDGARAALAKAVRAAHQLADMAELAALSEPGPAEPLWTTVAAGADPALASRALAALGELREARQDAAGAAAFYRRALAKEEAAHGKDSAGVALRLNALGVLLDPKEGIPMLERALAIDRKQLGERHPETSVVEANLAGVLLDAGRTAEAFKLAAAAVAGLESTMGPSHPRVASALSILALCWRAKGDNARAEKLYRRALTIDEAAYGPMHPDTRNDVKNLAEFLRDTGRPAEAAALEKRLGGTQR